MPQYDLNQPLILFDEDGIIFEANTHVVAMLNLPMDKIVGKNIVNYISKEYIDFFWQSAKSPSFTDTYFLLPVQIRDIGQIFVYVKIFLETLENKKTYACYITPIENVEQSLDIANKLLKYENMVKEITHISGSAVNKKDYLNEVLTIFGDTLNVEHAFLYKHVKEDEVFKLEVSYFDDSKKQDEQDIEYSFNVIPALLEKLSNGITHYCPDTRTLNNKYARENFMQIGVYAYINEPVFLFGELYGFFGYNMTTTNRETLLDDLTVVKSIARIITQTMERIEIIERLKQREFFSRMQIEYSDIGMAVFDLKKKEMIEANHRFYEIVGFTPEEYTKVNWVDHSPKEMIAEELILDQKLSNREIDEYSFEKPWRKGNGETVYVKVRKAIYWSEKGEQLYDIVTFEDITERTKAFQEIEYMSNHDDLTGLYNRRFFESYIKEIDHKKSYPLSIVVIDLNGLKLINDAFGHVAGDNMLKKTVETLQKHIGNKGVLSRIGGDEFAVFFPKTDSDEAHYIFQQIEKSCVNTYVNSVQLSLAYGIYTRTSNATPFYEDFKIAEDDMYRMKLLDVPSMRANAIETILNTLFEKDQYSKQHSSNVSILAERLAMKMGFNSNQVNDIKMAGLLHDIGKIIVPDSVLKKTTLLSSFEYLEIKKHSEIGYRILSSTKDFRQIANYVLSHHEHYDGKGYPNGISGETIPVESRIISIVDAFDAMISFRAYRQNKTKEEAIQELVKFSGKQFDPEIVDVFIEHYVDISKGIYN